MSDPLALGPADAASLRDLGYAEAEVRRLTSVPQLQDGSHNDVLAIDTRTLTDDGNALRLVDQHHATLRYVPQADKWLTWRGHRWQWDDAREIQERARDVIRRFTPRDEEGRKHQIRSLGAARILAMLLLARSDPRIVVHADQLDAHRLHLNTPGGIVDLTTGEMLPSDPAELHTRSTLVAPDPEWPTPRWNAFMEDTFSGDPDMIAYVRRLSGYSASGDVRHHILPFLYGGGQNGKSVLLEVLRALLGDYAASSPAKFLMAQKYGGHDTEIARLQGLRLVTASEVNQNNQFDEAKVKELTGGDALTARFMRQDYFTFEPTHHLWLAGNYKPAVKSGGDSFWRRLRLVPFLNKVPEERKIPNLAQLLVSEEGPGILAWIVAGAVDVFEKGMREPASVMEETKAYAAEEDHLGRFLEDSCHLGGGDAVKLETGVLRAAYEKWCHREGEQPLSGSPFGRELKTKFGIVCKPSNGKRFYLGVALLSLEEEPEGSER